MRPDALGSISWACSSAHPQRTVHDDLAVASDLLPALADVARRRDVTLIVEDCPNDGVAPDGQPGNLAYSPEPWRWLANLGSGRTSTVTPAVDRHRPVAALRDHGRTEAFQAKGVEVFPDARNHTRGAAQQRRRACRARSSPGGRGRVK
jgi:hypothetical protein